MYMSREYISSVTLESKLVPGKTINVYHLDIPGLVDNQARFWTNEVDDVVCAL